MAADKLYIGHVVTLDPREPVLEAVTVKDGLVQYAGTLDIARKLCNENTEVFDYGGNYIYPGFIDAHCHGVMAGPRLAFFADLTGGESMDDYIRIMKEYAESHPDNKALYGAGWSEKDRVPVAAMLDEICPDRPMALNSVDGHSYWMNSKAMEKFGIDKEAVKEWGTDVIRVDEAGNPTGYVSEGPVNAITNSILRLDDEDMKTALLVWQDFAMSQGITAYYEAGSSEHLLRTYRELIDAGKWKLRVYTGMFINDKSEDYVAEVRQAKALADKYNCEYLQVTGVKIFMDGVIEAHTAWMLEDYDDKPGYTGVKVCSDFDRVVDLYREAEKLGLSVHQHTIGDGAVKFALDCMEKVQTETENMAMRNALAHLQAVKPEDVKRLCGLNAVAVVAPLWMAKYEDTYRQSEAYIGAERTSRCYPLGSFADNSGIIAFHTDYPVSLVMSAPLSIYMACRRKEPLAGDDMVWNADECITPAEAIAGLTAGPAFAVKQENHLGSLQIGYVANMCIYDTDFIHGDPETIVRAKLLATVIDGNIEYRGDC